MTLHEPLAVNGGRPVRSEPYPWPIFGDLEEKLILEVLRSGRWSFDGPKEAELSRSVSGYLGVEHVLFVTSGTTALETAVESLGIAAGDEVLLPALTWTAPAHAIVRAGATPVFVDVDPHTWCMDTGAAEAAITERTKAILVVHTYSHLADLDAVLRLSRKYQLRVIEDCAHVFGSAWRGKSAGTVGDVGCFSFQQWKTLPAGEGGMLVTSDAELADRMYAAKNCGRRRRPEAESGFGGNQRITEFQAAILLAQLGRVDDQMADKNRSLEVLSEAVGQLEGISIHPPSRLITRRNFYGAQLSVDTTGFGGATTVQLAAALAAEGMPVASPHPVVYRSPTWTCGLPQLDKEERRARLGLDADCPVAERISVARGLIVAHEMFLAGRQGVKEFLAAVEKVRASAHSIPAHAAEERKL